MCAWKYEIVVAKFSWRTGNEDTSWEIFAHQAEY
jgi:hypothetical protein